MDEKKPVNETNITKDGLISAAAFSRLIKCSEKAASKIINDKLTEGVSYLREKTKVWVDVEEAKRELRTTIKPSTCKNDGLLEFLELSKGGVVGGLVSPEGMKNWTPQKVREELQKSELRISLTNEKILNEEYIDRQEIYKNAEAAGLEIRNKLINIGPRIAPEIASVPHGDIAKIEALINKEMEDVLMDLVSIFSKESITK